MNKKFTLYTLTNRKTEKFTLTPLELKEYINFEVKRVYFLSEVTHDTGEHCHLEEEELFIMIQGSCTVSIDKGNGKEDVQMVGGETAIYVPSYVWHGFKNLSKDAVIFALSSTNYRPDRSDYIEDYDAYLKIRDEKLQ